VGQRMGCGALAAPPPSGGGSAKYKAGEEQSQDTKRPNDRTDCSWHLRHCTDQDFELVHSIQEAYPFDNSTKQHHKKQTAWSLDEGFKSDWGHVQVTKLGPRKLFCDVCGVFIVERGGESEFYVCIRCRSKDRKLELCKDCFLSGRLHGTRHKHGRGDKADNNGGSFTESGSLTKGAGARTDAGATALTMMAR